MSPWPTTFCTLFVSMLLYSETVTMPCKSPNQVQMIAVSKIFTFPCWTFSEMTNSPVVADCVALMGSAWNTDHLLPALILSPIPSGQARSHTLSDIKTYCVTLLRVSSQRNLLFFDNFIHQIGTRKKTDAWFIIAGYFSHYNMVLHLFGTWTTFWQLLYKQSIIW